MRCRWGASLENSETEPNTRHGPEKPQTENLKHAYAGTTLDRHSLRDEGRETDELNEARLALVDTACTSCLHSRAWREAYQQTLPTGLECKATSNQKTFHFANGQSSDGRLQVWSIPVFLGGVRGEIHSAEMPEGTTPMLLSIPAMDALDMILFVKKRQAKIESLGLRVPLLQTRTKHLAIEIAYRPQDDGGHRGRNQPRLCSESGDLFVYYSEEARYPLLCHDPPCDAPAAFVTTEGETPDLGTRGVRAGDKTGQLTQRRARELQQAWGRQHRQDKRAKAALRRDYTMAEQWATGGFQDTCLFEPFARDAVLTKVGIKEMAWTCSSPARGYDGGEWLSQAGREFLSRVLTEHRPYLLVVSAGDFVWDLLRAEGPPRPKKEPLEKAVASMIVRLCRQQHAAGRYYLIEFPRVKHEHRQEALAEALESSASALSCYGDQCRFGAIDKESGKPERRRTRWSTNNELILNRLCLQCACPFGTHRGNQQGRDDSRQPPLPQALCRAVCQGVLESMCLDYAAAMAYHGGLRERHQAYPVGDGNSEMSQDTADDGDEDFEEPDGDDWILEGNRLIRLHQVPRRRLFVPFSSTAPPCRFGRIRGPRLTVMLLQDGTRRETS